MAGNIVQEGLHGTSSFPLGVYSNRSGPNGYLLYAHWHQDLEFFRLDEGNARLITEGNHYLLRPGDIAFIPSGRIHGAWLTSAEPARFTALVFDAALLENPYLAQPLAVFMTLAQRGPCRIFPAIGSGGTAPNPLTDSLDRLFQVYNSPSPGRELLLMSCLYSVLAELVRLGPVKEAETKIPPVQSREIHSLKLVMSFLQQEYRQNLGVEDMARVARMSPSHFMRYFKKMTGKTSMEYLMQVRLEKAAFLISSTNLTISHIASETGFANASHLIKRFQDRFGLTPARYKQCPDPTVLPGNTTRLRS